MSSIHNMYMGTTYIFFFKIERAIFFWKLKIPFFSAEEEFQEKLTNLKNKI